MRLTIDEADRIVDIRGDRENPMSKGYACFKGLQAEDAHHGPARLRRSLKRMPDGSFREISVEDALDEIADRLRVIAEREGPQAIAAFIGAGTYMAATAFEAVMGFMRALGSPAIFSDLTIDKPAKLVTPQRLGGWGAGKPDLEQSEVAMIFGANPIVSHQLTGFLGADPTKRLKIARDRGLDMVLVDPRRCETAQYAKVALQPYPGEDPTIAAGMLHIILARGWQDADFCAQHVDAEDLERLRRAVSPFTPEYVACRAGVPKEKLLEAVEVFAAKPRKGSVWVGTGLCMSPRGNLADHLANAINVICGRFRKAGDVIVDVLPWRPEKVARAEVIPPTRAWEIGPQSRIRGAGRLFGEMLACNFADEVLTPGEGQVRALINGGGGVVASMPDQPKTIRALKALELLVTIDPYMTTTARMSDYVLPVKLQYERADLPIAVYDASNYFGAYAAYTPELLKPPSEDVVDDWYIYWSIARRLGKEMMFDGMPMDMAKAPTTDGLIEVLARNGRVPLSEIKALGGGHLYDLSTTVLPAGPEADGKFRLMPADIAAELAEVAAERVEPGRYESNGQVFTHRLAVRRSRNVINSQVHHLPSVSQKYPFNPAWMNPEDLSDLGLSSGDRIYVVSDHGRIPAIVESDATVRRGVVMMSHGWGRLPEDGADYEQGGANTNLLISADRDVDNITAMVRMSAIPVNILPRATSAAG